jgi:hypothetical protein
VTVKVKSVGFTDRPPAETTTLTWAVCPNVSLTVTVALPSECGSTWKITGPGPVRVRGETVATLGLSTLAVIVPEYKGSLAVKFWFVVVPLNVNEVGFVVSGPMTEMLTVAVWPPPPVTVIVVEPGPTGVTVNVTLGPFPEPDTVATVASLVTAVIGPVYDDWFAVNGCGVPPAAGVVNVRLPGVTLSDPGGVTVMLTVFLPPWSSLTVIVVDPGPVGVTVKVTGLMPEAGETVATELSLLVAVICPVYDDSLALKVWDAPPTRNERLVGLTDSTPGGVTVTLTTCDPPWLSVTVMLVEPDPVGVTVNVDGLLPEAGVTVAIAVLPLEALMRPL